MQVISNTGTYCIFQIVWSFTVVEFSYNLLKTFMVALWPYLICISVIAGNIIMLEKFVVANQLTKKPQNFSTSDNLQYTVLSNVHLDLVMKTLQ